MNTMNRMDAVQWECRRLHSTDSPAPDRLLLLQVNRNRSDFFFSVKSQSRYNSAKIVNEVLSRQSGPTPNGRGWGKTISAQNAYGRYVYAYAWLRVTTGGIRADVWYARIVRAIRTRAVAYPGFFRGKGKGPIGDKFRSPF